MLRRGEKDHKRAAVERIADSFEDVSSCKDWSIELSLTFFENMRKSHQIAISCRGIDHTWSSWILINLEQEACASRSRKLQRAMHVCAGIRQLLWKSESRVQVV